MVPSDIWQAGLLKHGLWQVRGLRVATLHDGVDDLGSRLARNAGRAYIFMMTSAATSRFAYKTGATSASSERAGRGVRFRRGVAGATSRARSYRHAVVRRALPAIRVFQTDSHLGRFNKPISSIVWLSGALRSTVKGSARRIVLSARLCINGLWLHSQILEACLNE